MRYILALLVVIFTSLSATTQAEDKQANSGEIIFTHNGKQGYFNPRNTTVDIKISGDTAAVWLSQEFFNPYDEPLEARYTLPLSHGAAVTHMNIEVGEREIVGLVLDNQSARIVYKDAMIKGKTAALLKQKRDNVFKQLIGNIPPKSSIKIHIRTQELVRLDDGQYEFHFPMVVGPRFEPGISHADQVSPEVAPPQIRHRDELSITANIDTGLPVIELHSPSHSITQNQGQNGTSHITLNKEKNIPNTDFVLRWKIAKKSLPQTSIQLHRPFADLPGYFQLTVHPAGADRQDTVRLPRDFTFIIDTSGSMGSGPNSPLALAKDSMLAMLEELSPDDRFQLVTFAGSSKAHFPGFVTATAENKHDAATLIGNRQGGGGTQMLQALTHALETQGDSKRVRIAILFSDGYIGNESAIFNIVKKNKAFNTRFVGIGIGNNTNRLLFDGIEDLGHGLSQIMLMNDKPKEILPPLMKRLFAAQLLDITCNVTNNITLMGQNRDRIGSLFPGKPLVILGRYNGVGSGKIIVQGKDKLGRTQSFPVNLDWPAQTDDHASIATRWARERIRGIERRRIASSNIAQDVLDLSVAYQLISSQTSFVAVDREDLEKHLKKHHRDDIPEGIAARDVLQHDAQLHIVQGLTKSLPDGSIALKSTAFNPYNQSKPLFLEMEITELHTIDAAEPKGHFETLITSELGGPGAFMAIGAGGGSSGMFGSRNGGAKRRALGKYGASRASESAVDAGLQFTKRILAPNGSLSASDSINHCTLREKGFAPEPALTKDAEAQRTLYLSALGAQTYLQSGYDHRTPNKFRKQMKSLLDFLVQNAQAVNPDPSVQAAITKALAQAYSMTQDPALHQPAQRTVDFLIQQQLPNGAWGQDNAENNTFTAESITTLRAVLALRSAKAGGLDTRDSLPKTLRWVEAVEEQLSKAGSEGNWAKHWPSTVTHQQQLGKATLQSDIAGLTMMAFLGRDLSKGKAQALAKHILVSQETIGHDQPETRLYATLAMFQYGDNFWPLWNKTQRDPIIDLQLRNETCAGGSWQKTLNNPEMIQNLGNIGVTLFTTQTLQAYYSYEPLKKR